MADNKTMYKEWVKVKHNYIILCSYMVEGS